MGSTIRGPGILSNEKPSIFGIYQRTREVVIRMLADVQQATIEPLVPGAIAVGSVVHTVECAIYDKVSDWGYDHRTLCHADGKYSADDGFCESHVNTL